MKNEILIQHMDKFYGRKQALFDINLTIGKGMFGLLGWNGAGKTTLMKTLATLHKMKSGEINICDVPVENEKAIRAMTGYLPQDFSVYPNMRTLLVIIVLVGALSVFMKYNDSDVTLKLFFSAVSSAFALGSLGCFMAATI